MNEEEIVLGLPVGISYDEIDTLVFQFQRGDREASLKLIEVFKPYLRKFLKIIKDGVLNLKDKDSRKFIGLFITDFETKKKLLKNYQSSEVRYQAHKANTMLYNMSRHIQVDDLRQELIVILLTLAKRYKKKGRKINFCGYVYNTFRYEIYRRISQMTKDPIVHRSGINLSYNDDSYLDDDNNGDFIKSDYIRFINEYVMNLDDELGNSWERGLTCDEIFLELTYIQRLILKMRYMEDKFDKEIGAKLGMHRNTVRKQRQDAITKLEKKYEGGKSYEEKND